MHKWHVLGALALATLALGVLSIQAVRREAVARRSLVIEAHRGLADLVSARLNTNLAEDERAIVAAVASAGPRADAIVDALADLEATRPWLRPLVVMASAKQETHASVDERPSEASTGATAFDSLFRAAEREELALRRFDAAIPLYVRAAEASSAERRLEAMNGIARTEFKAGRPGRSSEASKRIIAAADNLDPSQARWALLAHDRLIDGDEAAGDVRGQYRDALALMDFMVRFRYVLDSDAVASYTQRVLEIMSEGTLTSEEQQTWQRLRDRETQLSPFDAAVRNATSLQRVGLRASVPFPLQAHVTASLQRVLRERGPWSAVGVALVDDLGRQLYSSVEPAPADGATATAPLAQTPNWRVLAFPTSGSLADIATRDVNRYALWLLLVFATVVTALGLAARSVARELALARLRAEFVASVSHELKTPLSLIRMFGESLREGWVSEPQKKDYYEVITRESERLTGLINNVLDFSRLESGTRRYSFDTIDLRKLVQDLLDSYEFHLRAANIEPERTLPDHPVHARADRDAIEQVVVNLLSNAVKYMGDPGRTPRRVRVALVCEERQAVLRVSDTGIGMSDEHRTHIFERFYRSDDERVRVVAGSGLGLTLVKAHIDAHHGTIAVDSTLGQGSTFAVSLPLSVQEAAP